MYNPNLYNPMMDVSDPEAVVVAIEEAKTSQQAVSCAYRGVAYLLAELLEEVRTLNANLSNR